MASADFKNAMFSSRSTLLVLINQQLISAAICVTQRPILRFFAQQGRHVAPMGVKFGTDVETFGALLRTKFHPIVATIRL